jgi:hypothetical protein
VVAWGDNSLGQISVPPLPPGLVYTQVATHGTHSVALRSDGSVVAWGYNYFGQATVPPLPAGLVYVQVAAGGEHSVALRSDGSVVGWGNNGSGQTTVPPPPPGLAYARVVAGSYHTLAFLTDGSVVGWGHNLYGQATIPPLPPGLVYAQVSAGGLHSVALRSDGSVVAWGYNVAGQTNVPPLPPGLTCVEVAAGFAHTVARFSAASPAQFNAFGVGCLGSNGVTTLSSLQLPFLGNAAFALDVSQAAPNSSAYVFFATAPAANRLPLAGGCFLYLDFSSFAAFVNSGLSPVGPVATGPAGVARFPFPVPAAPQLSGLSISFQAAVLDASTPLGLTLSNGVKCLIN